MTKRMLGLEVLLAVGIVSITAGITQVVPWLKNKGADINLGATMAKALEQTDLTTANNFRYLHVKMENNQQLADENFNNEINVDMQVWGYQHNARMDATTLSANDNKEHTMNLLMLPDNDRGCMAFDGYYECEAWPEINMEPLTDNTTLSINEVRVDDNTISFWTKQSLPDNTEVDFSVASSGYSDAGNTVELDHTGSQKYYYVINLTNMVPLTREDDLNIQTVQFQLEAVQGKNIPALESPVFEWNQQTNVIQQLTVADITAAQQRYAEQLKADRAAQPSVMEMFLNDGPFSIVKRLRDGKINLDKPLERHQVHYNGKTALSVVYSFPVEYAQSTIERYVEIILDPATQTIFEYTLLNEQKGMVSRVTFLENKVITDIDPTMFFTEDYWENELHLIEGRNPNIPDEVMQQQPTRTETVQPGSDEVEPSQ